MVHSKRRIRKKQQKLLGNHQKCWIWGRNVVQETLQVGVWDVLELVLSQSLPTDICSMVTQLADERSVPVKVETNEALSQLCGSADHQGLIAKMPPFPYADVDEILERPTAVSMFLVLDRIQDPFNFGAILRSAEVLGVDAVFVGQKNQSAVTSLVVRSSAGAVNHLPIAQVASLSDLAQRLKSSGIQLVGTSLDTEAELFQADFTKPTALLIGNEGSGIDDGLLQMCDSLVKIPQVGRTESLNAAVASGIVLYEVARQRQSK